MSYRSCFVCLFLATMLTTQVSGQWNSSIQLQGSSFWGYIQVLQDDQLKYICNDYWDIEDGRVACRQLGLGDVFTVEGEQYPTSNTISDVFLCEGIEGTLMECQRTLSLSDTMKGSCNAAYVSCGVPDPKEYSWEYIGCFQDNNDRILPDLKCDESITGTCRHCLNDTGQYFCADYNGMTVDLCLQVCCTHGYVYAGLENGDQCFCGDQTADYSRYGMKSSSECSSPCKGNTGQECGGVFTVQVFECLLHNVTTAQPSSTESMQQTSIEWQLTSQSDQSNAPATTPIKEPSRGPTTSSSSTNELNQSLITSPVSTTDSSQGHVTSSVPSSEPSETAATSQVSTKESDRYPATSSMSTKVSSLGPVSQSISMNEPSRSPTTSPVPTEDSRLDSATPILSTMDSSQRPHSPSDINQVVHVTTLTTLIPSTEKNDDQGTTYKAVDDGISTIRNTDVPNTNERTTSASPSRHTSKASIDDSTATDSFDRSSSATQIRNTSTSIKLRSLSDGTTEMSRSIYLTGNTPTSSEVSMSSRKTEDASNAKATTAVDNNNIPDSKDESTALEADDMWYLYMILAALCLIPFLIFLIRCCCWNTGHRERHTFDYSQCKGSKKNGVLAEDPDCDSLDDNCIITRGTIIDEEVQPVPIPSYHWVPIVKDNQQLIEKDTSVDADPVWNIGSNDGVVDNEAYEGGTELEVNGATPANGVECTKKGNDVYSQVDFSKKRNKKPTIIIDTKSFNAP